MKEWHDSKQSILPYGDFVLQPTCRPEQQNFLQMFATCAVFRVLTESTPVPGGVRTDDYSYKKNIMWKPNFTFGDEKHHQSIGWSDHYYRTTLWHRESL